MLQIRKAVISDIPGLIDVMKSSGYFQFRYSGYSEEKAQDRIFKELIKPGHIHLFVAEKEGRIVGYTIIAPYGQHRKDNLPLKVTVKDKEIDLSDFAYSWGTGVHEDFRRQGIGLALRRYADAKAKELGFAGFVTNVDKGNSASIQNQKKAGYILAAEFDDPKRKSGVETIWVKEF